MHNQTQTCSNCNGDGQVYSYVVFRKDCPVCHGVGTVKTPQRIQLTSTTKSNFPQMLAPALASGSLRAQPPKAKKTKQKVMPFVAEPPINKVMKSPSPFITNNT